MAISQLNVSLHLLTFFEIICAVLDTKYFVMVETKSHG